MLVLTRKCQEVVVVAGTDGLSVLLKVTVLGIDNGKVRLGFEAAGDVPVHRQEVWDRIRAMRLTGVGSTKNREWKENRLQDIGGEG